MNLTDAEITALEQLLRVASQSVKAALLDLLDEWGWEYNDDDGFLKEV